MKSFALLAGISALAIGASVAPSWAANWYVDAENGTDNTTCGQSLASGGSTSGPCATLNKALSVATDGDTIFIEHPGTFGPIYLTSSISIVAPENQSVMIVQNGAAPGCVGAAPGTCASANTSAAAVEVADTNSNDAPIKLKNLILNAGQDGIASVHIANGWNVVMERDVLRTSGSNTNVVALLYDQSATAGTSGTPHQIYMSEGDIAFSNNAGGVFLEPTVPTSANFNKGKVHHLKFGIKLNSTLVSGGNLSAVLDDEELSSFNTNAVAVVATSGGQANASISRSTISQASTDGVYVDGSGAFAEFYEDVITQTATGIQLSSSGTGITFGNNDIYSNGTNVSGTLSAAPAGVGGSTQ
jgi:hypothetical protein